MFINKENLIEAMSNINDDYITETAVIKKTNLDSKKGLQKSRKRVSMNPGKWISIAASIALVFVFLIPVFLNNRIVNTSPPYHSSEDSSSTINPPVSITTNYTTLMDIDAILYDDARRFQSFNYPIIEKMPEVMPVYKTKYLNDSTAYLQTVAELLGLDIYTITINNNNMLSEHGFLSYSSCDLCGAEEYDFTNADILTVYNNGSFYLSLIYGKEVGLLGLSLHDLSNDSIIENVNSFISSNNTFFGFLNPEIHIIENTGAYVHISVSNGNDSDTDKILSFNGLLNTLEIRAFRDTFIMNYSTNRYYEFIEQKKMYSYNSAYESALKGEATISPSLTNKVWLQYNVDLISEDDLIIDGYIIYSYDSEGLFRPVWVFKKEAKKTGVDIGNGLKQYKQYFVFIDPLKTSEEE